MKANTIYDPIKIKEVIPVRHVTGIRYDNSDSGGSSGSFRQALENATKREQKPAAEVTPKEALVAMAGMNQYDRHAREIFFVLSSQTDYEC